MLKFYKLHQVTTVKWSFDKMCRCIDTEYFNFESVVSLKSEMMTPENHSLHYRWSGYSQDSSQETFLLIVNIQPTAKLDEKYQTDLRILLFSWNIHLWICSFGHENNC